MKSGMEPLSVYEITLMNNETVAARKVFNFLVARRKGSERAPVKYGNVEFWHEVLYEAAEAEFDAYE